MHPTFVKLFLEADAGELLAAPTGPPTSLEDVLAPRTTRRHSRPS